MKYSREYYEKKYRHLNLYFGHGEGWDEITLEAAQILNKDWPKVPRFIKLVYAKILESTFIWQCNILRNILLPKNIPPQFSQIKEKYGHLCLYLTTATRQTHESIHKLEKNSREVCEQCGACAKTQKVNNWYYTLCDKCLKNHLNRFNNN
jgi:hypothetical protein